MKWPALDEFEGSPFDLSLQSLTEFRGLGVEVNRQRIAARFMFFDADAADFRQVKQLKRILIFELGYFFLGCHNLLPFAPTVVLDQRDAQRREDFADVVANRVRRGSGKQQADGFVGGAFQNQRP